MYIIYYCNVFSIIYSETIVSRAVYICDRGLVEESQGKVSAVECTLCGYCNGELYL